MCKHEAKKLFYWLRYVLDQSTTQQTSDKVIMKNSEN